MHCFGSFLLQAMFLRFQLFALRGKNMKLTVKMLFTCILRCDAGLFTASVRRGRPLDGRVVEISINIVDEQVTEYSNLWLYRLS